MISMATNDMNKRSSSASGGKVITGDNRPTMGTSVGVDGPRSQDFRTGFLEAKPGSVGDPVIGTKANRGQVMQETLGARYSITVKQIGGTAYPDTQRNTRLVPSVHGDRDNFWAHG